MTPELTDRLTHGLEELQNEPDGSQALKMELRHLCQTNLYYLVKAVLTPFEPQWDAQSITRDLHWKMAQFCQAPPAKFTMLMAFRGAYKSTFGTIGYTVQQMLKGSGDVLIFSEATLMAEDWSRQARRHFEGDNRLLTWLFPELIGSKKKWGDGSWELPNGGSVKAAGMDTAIMGVHVDHIVMDDIFSDPRGEKTPEFAQKAIQWVKMSVPLLKRPSTGIRRLTGVPWWVSGEPYAHFRKVLPEKHRFEMPLEVDGECVWPEIFPPDVIAELKRDPIVYASQYALNPVTSETAIFKSGVVKTYTERPDYFFTRIMVVDPAFTKHSRSHHNAVVIAEKDAKGKSWVEFAEKKKLDGHEAVRWAIERAIHYKPTYLATEANGPQRLFYDAVKRGLLQYPGDHPARKIIMVELKPSTDKTARLNRLASAFVTNQVKIHTRCTELVTELYKVTGAKHEENDLADATAHLVGPELSKKKPMILSQASPEAWLPHALRDPEVQVTYSHMAA